MPAVLYLVLIVLAFFFLVVRPQRRQLTAHRALVASLQVGDDVVTSGGIHGTIRSLDDDLVYVEVADGIVIRVARAAIAQRVSPEPQTPLRSEDQGDGDGDAPNDEQAAD